MNPIPRKPISLRNYTIFNQPHLSDTKAKGNVLLAIEKSLFAEELIILSSLQVVAVRLFVPFPVTLCSIYLPLSEKISKEQLSDLVSSLEPPFFIAGDFNAHNPLWGGSSINHNGKILEECIDYYNLVIHNTARTHFNSTYHTWSTIDLIISSASQAGSILTYPHKDLAGSDHTPLLMNPSAFRSPQPQIQPRWNYRKTDWLQFKSSLEDSWKNPDLSASSDDIIHQFTSQIIETAKSCTPKPKTTQFHKKLVW